MALQVHLGSGKRYIPDFIHVDLADFPHIDYQHDIMSLPMFEDETVDLIYACHVLEYFDRIQVLDVLREWSRVLKPDAVLRLAVPDFEAMVAVYQKTKDLSLIHGPLFGRWSIGADDQNEQVIYHKTVYEFASLQSVLEFSGFQKVRRYDWRETIHKDYDDYSQAYIPHMDKDDGTLISLNVAASKAPLPICIPFTI